MSLSYSLNQVYYQSDFYLYFSIFQLIFNFGLLGYLMSDFSAHFRQPFVICSEVMVFFFMAIDVTIYTIVNGSKCGLFNFIEWTTLLGFVICFVAMLFNGVKRENEKIEVYLMIIRFCLQAVRLFVGIARVRENNEKRRTVTNLQIHADNLGISKDAQSSKNIEIIEI